MWSKTWGLGRCMAILTWTFGRDLKKFALIFKHVIFQKMDALWRKVTLQGTNISPQNGILKMIFLFPRWDMLIPRRVLILSFFVWQMRDIFHIFMLNFANKYRWNIHTIRPIPSFISTSPATLIFSHQFFWGLPCWRWLCHSFRWCPASPVGCGLGNLEGFRKFSI